MPLFMDRHDLRVTPEEVARAHDRDREVAPKHGVEFLTYWFDPDVDAVFCLARAPAPENVTAAHEEAHGLIPSEVIPVSEEAVLRFLGNLHEPADHTEITTSFRTIVFTDLEGSTAMADKLGTSAFMEVLGEHDLIVRRSLVTHRGREVKHTGDGIMASFDEVADALECALQIREAESRARIRVGMAAGEPVDHNNDLFGPTVNLASRICDAAQAGEVLVSDVVGELGASGGFYFVGPNALNLRGFAKPITVFTLTGHHDREEAPALKRVGPPQS
jgi:class 3 adenylate cyclase